VKHNPLQTLACHSPHFKTLVEVKEQALICTRRNHFRVPSVSVSLQKMSADAVTGGAVPLHAASFRCDDGAMLCDIITEDGPAKLLAS
jgi:hypothetical protein